MDGDLIDHQNKCRFCLGRIKSTRIAVNITGEIEQSFFRLTNTKLKSSRTYSSVICKTCFKDLESAVGFQQKIIVNQLRLENFEFDEASPVKEEAVEAEDLKTVEIKTECFELEPACVVQSWQGPPEDEILGTEIKIDGPVESPASEDSDEDFSEDRHEGDSSDELNLIEETPDHEQKTPKIPETCTTRICPYCAGVYSKSGIKAHIERHENKMNNTQLKCQFCEFKSYCQSTITTHIKSKHPEKCKRKGKKAKGVIYTDKERRQIIVDARLADPLMSCSALAKRLKLSRKTVADVLKRYKTTKSIDRAPNTGISGRTGDKELYDRIARSFSTNPEWSDRFRAKTLRSSTGTVGRVRRKIGFQVDVDDSAQIYQCKQCPRKYSHNQTLWTHVRDKHRKRPE